MKYHNSIKHMEVQEVGEEISKHQAGAHLCTMFIANICARNATQKKKRQWFTTFVWKKKHFAEKCPKKWIAVAHNEMAYLHSPFLFSSLPSSSFQQVGQTSFQQVGQTQYAE